MGITGLIPFIEKASRRANVGEFSGCTVAIDSYCWLHKGAFACADKLVRGEQTNVHIMYCLKYVMMLMSKNIKPILVFDGRHLPAKALTESKRRESRNISKKRAAELLSLGKIDEARSYMRRSVDITHAMALALIKECRQRNVDCIVAPYEADAQLAYLNIKNIAQLVITEDSDLILFGCKKVLFKMDLDGSGTLVDTVKLPLAMRCPIEQYRFDKFRQMCIMSGCDYLPSLPGIGLAKARQFVVATQDNNFANALRKLPSFFNRSSLIVTDEYRESFMKAEATFKHQYVYDPLERKMVRLTEPDDEDIEKALCVNAGEPLDPDIAFQLALGNVDPFTLKKMDDWHPDTSVVADILKTNNWKEKAVSPHPSMWKADFKEYLNEPTPWQKKVKKPPPIIAVPQTRPRKKVVNLVKKYVPETQDESLTIESLSSMYCVEPASKKQRTDCDSNFSESLTQYTQSEHNIALAEDKIVKELPSSPQNRSPILENKERSYKKLKRFSKFPRTVLGQNIIESKFFNNKIEVIDEDVHNSSRSSVTIEESPEKCSMNPFKLKAQEQLVIDTQCIEIPDSQIEISSSQKENPPHNSPLKIPSSPILKPSPHSKNPFKLKVNMDVLSDKLSADSVIDNTYPYETLVTPVDSQLSFGDSPPKQANSWNGSRSQPVLCDRSKRANVNGVKKTSGKVTVLKKSPSLPSNQPTLLSKFGFQKKPALKR